MAGSENYSVTKIPRWQHHAGSSPAPGTTINLVDFSIQCSYTTNIKFVNEEGQMATRSSIAVLQEDGSVRSIYVHSDGYPSHTGRLLDGHYSTADAANELINKGDASCIGETLDRCMFYADMPGERLNVSVSRNIEQWYNRYREQYNYLWKDGTWYLVDRPDYIIPLVSQENVS